MVRDHGFDFRHEEIGTAGGCGYNLGPTVYCTPKIVEDPQAFGPFFHQIRHPLRVCASLPALPGVTDSFVRQHLQDKRLPTVRNTYLFAGFWLYWNQRLEQFCDWTFRVEDLKSTAYEQFRERVGFHRDVSASVIDDTLSTRRRMELYRHDLTWDVMKREIPAQLYEEIRSYANRFDYD